MHPLQQPVGLVFDFTEQLTQKQGRVLFEKCTLPLFYKALLTVHRGA